MATRRRPAAPTPQEPPTSWAHHELYDSVTAALYALPSLFASELSISGILATDLFALNTALGATIEVQVVEGLNRIRRQWDPDEEYALYRWVRQPQSFPDVTLRASAPGVTPEILMGIELKGFYVLSKEREPTFRFKVTPAVCQPQDLLVVYPWALRNVLSGQPSLFQPFVTPARYAAELRNWYWEYGRETNDDAGVTLSTVTQAYPSKDAPISDTANYDAGGNFGRVARYGLMDEWVSDLSSELLAGIPVSAWQRFIRLFAQDWSEQRAIEALERMGGTNGASREELAELLAELIAGED